MSNLNPQYPLQNDAAELARLDAQAEQLFDSAVVPLVKGAQRILEIGCGSGANGALFRRLNPGATYLGVDIDPAAVAGAASCHSDDVGMSFAVMAGDDLALADETFDLVVIRLVLWGAGPAWPRIVAAAHRVLRTGGTLYSFEPEDRLLLFHPPDATRDDHVKAWQQAMHAKGNDPFVGAKVPAAMHAAGFAPVRTLIHASLAVGLDVDAYRAKCENLARIFMGPSLPLATPTREDLWQRFTAPNPSGFVTDSYVVAMGVK